ncbi:MAG: class I SAM-dependent methyltransferase [bacterium]|nr:class I SAM-dependent methyltransferase [bacterium]
MNRIHDWYCKSARWKRLMVDHVLPDVLDGVDLQGRVLEIGPGPGLVTAALLECGVAGLTTVEIDPRAAERLRGRFGSSVTVHTGSASDLPLADQSFDVVVCCTMLHHVPTAAEQDDILAECRRVLAPGGVLAGSDSKTSPRLRMFHLWDTYNPVDPAGLEARLAGAGFDGVLVTESEKRFLFKATAPV